MTDEMETAGASVESKPAYRGVIRRVRKAGVAQSGIFSRLAHVKQRAKISTLQRITPAFRARKTIERFVTEFRERQPSGMPVLAKKAAPRKKSDWQKMEMVLPSGSVAAEGQRIPPETGTFAPFTPTGNLSAGQVIPPFEPSNREPALGESAFSRRMKQISGGQPAEKPQPKKRIAPQSRLYSKVVEINPRKTEQTGDLPESDSPLPEPPSKPAAHTVASPNTVQRLPAEPADPAPKRSRLRPAEIKPTIEPTARLAATPESKPETKPAAQYADQSSHPAAPQAESQKPDPGDQPAQPAKPAVRAAGDLPVWKARPPRPELRRLSPVVRREPLPLRKPAKPADKDAQPVQSASTPAEPGPKWAPKPAKTEPPAHSQQPEPRPVFMPAATPPETETQPPQPVDGQPKPEMSLFLKPRIRPMPKAALPVLLKPRAAFPINIIRRQPEKPASAVNPARPQPQKLEASLPVRLQPHSAEPPAAQHQPDRQPAAQPERANRQPARAYAPRQKAALADRKLTLPLQRVVQQNISRPVSRLTVLKRRTDTVQREPAAQNAQPISQPTRRPAEFLPAATPQKAAALKRELIHQPALPKQAASFGRVIRRKAENRAAAPAKPATQSRSAAAVVLPAVSRAPGADRPETLLPGGQSPRHGLRRTAAGLPNLIQREPDPEKKSNYITEDEAKEPVTELHGSAGYVSETPPAPPPDSSPSSGSHGGPPSHVYYQTDNQNKSQEENPVYLRRGSPPSPETRQETSPEPDSAPYELRSPYEPELPASGQLAEYAPVSEPDVVQYSRQAAPDEFDRAAHLNYTQLAKDVLPIIKKMLALERERTVRR